MKLTGLKVPPSTLYLAYILDDFNLLLWSFSKNANSINKPKSIADSLIDKPQKPKEYESFNSGAEFERRRAEILQNIINQDKDKTR